MPIITTHFLGIPHIPPPTNPYVIEDSCKCSHDFFFYGYEVHDVKHFYIVRNLECPVYREGKECIQKKIEKSSLNSVH